MKNHRTVTAVFCNSAFALAFCIAARAQQPLAPPPIGGLATDQPQVLTRGPVHEAFAETIVFNPEPGLVVPKPPPAPPPPSAPGSKGD